MLSLAAVAAVAYCSPHVEKPWAMATAALWTPVYKEGLRHRCRHRDAELARAHVD